MTEAHPDPRRRNIVLVGFMGTGKTTVGRRLAARLGFDFLDMDQEIERREGRSIADIFARDGEARFREIERALAAELAARHGLVIAAGGGVVLDERNLNALGATGLVVCLTASVDAILARVGGDQRRPLLAAADRRERVEALLRARAPFYARVPHQLDTTGLSSRDVVLRLESLARGNAEGT